MKFTTQKVLGTVSILFGMWLLYIVHTLGIIADAIRATLFGWAFILLGLWLLTRK